MSAPHTLREPCAPGFYRGDPGRQVAAFLRDFVPSERPARPVAGLVPHAGWVYSGRTAARVFRNLAEKRGLGDGAGVTFVLLGAVHRWGVRQPAVYPGGAWRTPDGVVAVDADLAAALLDAGREARLVASAEAHDDEHSIEVQVPLLRELLPAARIVPVALPPTAEAPAAGRVIGEVAARWSDATVLVVGTTDLTHYGASYGFAPAGQGPPAEAWMAANDHRIIERATGMDAGGVLAEAAQHHNACGAGAVAATIAAARALGAAEGVLVEYTTSHAVRPDEPFSMAVGYAGILYG
jgi:hypothetical protein